MFVAEAGRPVVYRIKKKSILNKTLQVYDTTEHVVYEKRQRGFFKTKKMLLNVSTSDVVWETSTQDNTTQAITFSSSQRIIKLRSGATHSSCPLNNLLRCSSFGFCWQSDHFNWMPVGNCSHSMRCVRSATGCEVAEFTAIDHTSSSAVGTLIIRQGQNLDTPFCEFLLFSLIHLWEDLASGPPPLPSPDAISLPSTHIPSPLNSSIMTTASTPIAR
ncbi:hypothetical protein H4R34_001812 [Dimargaris verticillata]|uniref:Uncharacterized protein n=1 Tax=Dimargaris verticillata TaxID=2761393 RepID=A0A9W8EDF7_9FUNG|nr:hypothetical protein H4R34_001812 [Dimargaris verticillata]